MDLMNYAPRGDKKNSEFFDEYRLKIYERRKASGLDQLLGDIRALVVQVDTGDAIATMEELYVMTPYRLVSSYVGATHKVYVLQSKPEFPRYILIEPLSPKFEDMITRFNAMYPLARPRPNSRYVGEVFAVTDRKTTQDVLESHSIRFEYPDTVENPIYACETLLFTAPSDYTGNRIGYTEVDLDDPDALCFGERFQLTAEEQGRLDRAAATQQEQGIADLILGVDHMATRILSGEREDAILEFLTLSDYYFWGAYNIERMNSSTNVNRNGNVDDDKISPAKVFTANNLPSFVNSFENRPMPTEDFVRNYGRRMHHIAQEVQDGDHPSGQKNVDFVVGVLKELGTPFLAHVVGECKDSPDLKQIFSKHSQYTLLITEYVERCHHFDGFFTKTNVAALTEAAGQDEQYRHGRVFD